LIGSKKQQEREKNKSMDTKRKQLEIDESLGELVCDVCGGRGVIPSEITETITYQSICWKCQGDGKVDWVSHITGKPQKPMFGFASTSSFTASTPNGGHSHIYDDAIDAMAHNLAAKIDEEIIDKILNGDNKHIKYYNQEVKQFDNGIVSKFMFHTDT